MQNEAVKVEEPYLAAWIFENTVFEYSTGVNVHSITETAELEPSREKEHAVHHVLQE